MSNLLKSDFQQPRRLWGVEVHERIRLLSDFPTDTYTRLRMNSCKRVRLILQRGLYPVVFCSLESPMYLCCLMIALVNKNLSQHYPYLLKLYWEWVVIDLALSKIMVPSITIASLELLAPILNHHLPSTVVCHTDLLPQILKYVTGSQSVLHLNLVVIGQNYESEEQIASLPSLTVLRWDDIEKAGEQSHVPLPTPSEHTLWWC